MDLRVDPERETDLQFFGKMTASISHEIKNVIAIINESAGLLEDYSLMAQKGRPIDPDRLNTVSERVTAQVRRAGDITKNLNSLAHSVDDFKIGVDVREILELAVAISSRLADMRSVRLILDLPSEFPTVITSQFHFLNLMWQILDYAMDVSGEEKTVRLTFEVQSGRVNVRFTGLSDLANGSRFPTEKENALLNLLGGTLQTEIKTGEILLSLPKNTG